MIYRPAQIVYWPRLIAAARSIDGPLTAALEELVTGGATLGIDMQGNLQFGADEMPRADYDRIVAATLRPRSAKLVTLAARIRTAPHPWLTAVQKASNDLEERCKKATIALVDAARAGNTARWASLAPTVLDRYFQAQVVARALCDAGFGAYLAVSSAHHERIANLMAHMTKAGLSPDDGARFWPIETADGWLWLTDFPVEHTDVQRIGNSCVVFTQGKEQRQKCYTDGEPIIPFWDMAGALAAIDLGRTREAG